MKQLVVVAVMANAALVRAHLALMDPPARNVLWRAGWSLPQHPQDDYLICSEEAGRSCPPCGDSADSPRPLPHQAGGEWAQGILARNYTQGETISVQVSVTNSHKGPLEFKLCPHDDVKTPVKQSCLDKYPLRVVDPPGGAAVTADYQATQELTFKLQLPAGLTCHQCIVQMTNYAEQFKPSNVMFRNCADVSIGSSQWSDAAKTSQRQPARRPNTFRNTKDFNDASDFSSTYNHQNHAITFPQTSAKAKSSSKAYPSRSSEKSSSFDRSYEDQGYTYEQDVIYQPWLYEDQFSGHSKSGARKQRQSVKPKSKKHKQTRVNQFSVKQGKTDLGVSEETLAQLSGANKEKLLRGAGKKNSAHSGFVQPNYDSAYRTRSKSMFPVHQTPHRSLAFAGSLAK